MSNDTSDLLAIYDTRDPEGDGMPMRDPADGEVVMFETHDDARVWLALMSISPSRVIIAPYDDGGLDEERAVDCPGDCGARAGEYCREGCSSYNV
jgi:hypothetical protein